MALVTTKRNVDVLPGQAAPTVFHCSQHDVGATVILGLVNAGGNFSIPSGVTAIIQGSCSNGAVFTPVTATVSGSDITFNLSAEMTSIAGPTVCEAVLSKDTDVLGTANFILDVEPSAMGSDTPPVFTDAAWLWMVDKMGTETVSALGDKTVIDAINGKANQADVTALSNGKLNKNQGAANAGKYLKVGADGNVETADLDVTTDKTLSIADKAADAKAVGDELTDLKTDLISELDYTILNPSLNKGSYVNVSGTLSSGANYCYTDPIAIAKGEQVQLIVVGGMTSNVACIFSCNQDGTSKAMIVQGGNETEYTYLAAEDGYVGFSFNFTYSYEMKKYGTTALPVLTTKVDDLTAEVDFTNSALQKTLIAPDAKASGYRLYSSGLSVANRIFELRKYAVTAGEKLLVMTDTPPSDGAVYIFNVGSNASSSSSANIVSVQVTPVNGEITVPERATYLIMSALKIDTTSGVYRYNVFSDSDIVALNTGFKAKANQGLAKLNKAADASTLPPILSLLHFSDIHGNSTNLSRIVEFKNAYRNLIKDAVCTGDMTANVFSDGMTFWNNVDGAEKIMMCIGNHDVAVSGDYSHYGVTVEQAYNQFFAPYIANWNCVYESGKTYWYKDYSTEKIRLIALDYLLTGDDATAQNAWLATALSGAKTNGYAVVGIEHTPPATRTKINTTFTSLLNDYGGTFGSPYMQTVQDFIDNDGVFLCWLGGHTHVDYVEYNPNYPAQPFIIVTSAKGATGYEDGNRIVGDRSRDAFNVVFLDAGSKLVKLVRVGQDRDAQLRHIDTLTLDVSTSPATVVWND